MKQAVLTLVMLLSAGLVQARGLVTANIGTITSDNENVESAVVGKVDVGFSLNKFISVGLSAGQTGQFDEKEVPKEVVFANTHPQAFAGKKAGKQYFKHGDDIIIIHNHNTNINVFVSEAPPIKPSRPFNRNESQMWMMEPHLTLGLPIKQFRPYVRGFLGASGVKDWGGDHTVGISKGVGAGLDFNFRGLIIGFEANRRYIDTNRNTYSNNECLGKIGLLF